MERIIGIKLLFKIRGSSNIEDARFDETIGCIQDILLGTKHPVAIMCVNFILSQDEEFNKMKRSFMERHYHHFEDTDENKFIYTDIFQQYVSSNQCFLWQPQSFF